MSSGSTETSPGLRRGNLALRIQRSFRVRRSTESEGSSGDRGSPNWLNKFNTGRRHSKSNEELDHGMLNQPSPMSPSIGGMMPSGLALFGSSNLGGGCQTILVMGAPKSGKTSLIEALKFQERFEDKEENRNKRTYIEIHSDQDDLWRTLSGVVTILVLFQSDSDKSLKMANETLQILHSSSSITSPLVLVGTKMESKSKSTMQNAEKCGKRLNTQLVEVSARLHTNMNVLSAVIRQLANEHGIGTKVEECSLITNGLRHCNWPLKKPKTTNNKQEVERTRSALSPSSARGGGMVNLLVPNAAPILHLAAKSCDSIPTV